MRALLLATALCSCGCTALGATSPGDAEAAARGALGRDRVTDIRLTQVDERTFDFSGTRERQRCEGTVIVTIRGETWSSAIESRCE